MIIALMAELDGSSNTWSVGLLVVYNYSINSVFQNLINGNVPLIGIPKGRNHIQDSFYSPHRAEGVRICDLLW